jgi:membrane-bound lytic murein transglycosylase D
MQLRATSPWGTRSMPLPSVHRLTPEVVTPIGVPIGFRSQQELFIQPAINPAVTAEIAAYRGRADLGGALGRGSKYLQKFQEIFASEGVPPELVYLALVESEFRPDARSWVSAFGVWQFMPETGQRFGLKQNAWVDERGDPLKGARAAARYLRVLYDQFGDWNLAMASYNAGERAVERAIDKYKTRDFWQLYARGALPQETRDYVPRIHAAMTIARDPERYGVIVTPQELLDVEAVPLATPVDLNVAARCLGADVQSVIDLNPALKHRVTPLEGEFALNVPVGRGPDVQACIDRLPPDQRVRIHVVEPGQTLSKVAQIYNTRASRLAEANDLKPTQKLPKGLELVIPLDEQ